MKQAQFGVFHQGCWGSYATEKFPDISTKQVGPVQILKNKKDDTKVQCLWSVDAPNKKELEVYLDHIKRLKDIKKFIVFEKSRANAFIATKWKSPSSSYDVVMKNNCFNATSVIQEAGYEIYSIIAENPKEILKTVSDLEAVGQVKVFKISDYAKKKNLMNMTERQIQALKTALVTNYYTWPRKTNLDKMSKQCSMTRRAFQENLRKAEMKAFPKLLKKMLDDGTIIR